MQEKSSVYLPLTLTFLGLRHAFLAKERSKGRNASRSPRNVCVGDSLFIKLCTYWHDARKCETAMKHYNCCMLEWSYSATVLRSLSLCHHTTVGELRDDKNDDDIT